MWYHIWLEGHNSTSVSPGVACGVGSPRVVDRCGRDAYLSCSRAQAGLEKTPTTLHIFQRRRCVITSLLMLVSVGATARLRPPVVMMRGRDVRSQDVHYYGEAKKVILVIFLLCDMIHS